MGEYCERKKIVTFILLQLAAFGLFTSLPAYAFTPVLTSIAVTPVNHTISAGKSLQYTPTGTFSDGTTRTLIGGDKAWRGSASMPRPRSNHAVATVNGTLYAMGGSSGSSALSSMQAYDPATNKWTPKASMATPRYYFAAGVVNGILYAVGGNNSNIVGGLATMEAYDPVTDTWTPRASMTTPRWGHAVGVVDGILYAMGGASTGSGGDALVAVEAYDPATNTWTPRASMPVSRFGHAVDVVDGMLYVVAGNSGGTLLASVDAYNPATNTWTPRASMSTPRWLHSVGVIDGILYAVGGGAADGIIDLATMEAYNPTTNTWSAEASLSTPRQGLGVGAVNRTLYAVGGWSASGSYATVEAYTPPDEIIWSSSNTSVATITQSGVAFGASVGQTSITATSGSISGSTSLMVVDTVPPSVPTGLTGSDVSKTQINLAWTASTDNVGVAGYKIERCAGSKCTNFVQVGTSATTSFSNTGLAERTTYKYRVRAYDAAGNNSGYSNIVAATTLK